MTNFVGTSAITATTGVSFQWKNPDFLVKNPDFLLKMAYLITKTG